MTHRTNLLTIWKKGDPLVWFSAAALLFLVVMIGGMFWLILSKGLSIFWSKPVALLTLSDGRQIIGEIHQREPILQTVSERKAGLPIAYRIQLKVGNRDIYGQDFRWISEADIVERSYPSDVFGMERLENGNMYGTISELQAGETTITGEGLSASLRRELRESHRRRKRIQRLTEELAKIREPITALEFKRERGLVERTAVERDIAALEQELAAKLEPKEAELAGLHAAQNASRARVTLAGGTTHDLLTEDIVRLFWPNDMNWFQKAGLYISRFAEFVVAEPREANTEGGIFPAILGTVTMVMLMTVAVVPLGVLVAIYLREYAKAGLFVRAVRIAMNNLAGVPSIVFGMFGLGFFIYFVGGGIDQLFFSERLPAPTFGTGGILWASLTLALLTLPVVVVSTEEALAAVPRANRDGALALAATKLQMLVYVVIPNAMPGILTGMILAISRGAGEVAPLMITGAVKLAPNLPLDGTWPFAHLERKFMHLGFHIFDVGFQSPNVEAAKPMVYTTALLLILLVLGLNLFAMVIRNRLRKRYRGAAL